MIALLLALFLTGCGGGLRRIETPAAARQPPAAVVDAEARHQYLLGRVLLGEGRVAEAREAFAQARRFDPLSGRIAVGEGDAALAAGDPDGALQAWRRAVELDPALADAWLRIARVERARGALEQAEASFRRAIQAGAGWHARAELVEVLVARDDREGAATAARAWADSDEPLPGAARRVRAEARLAAGDGEGAFQDLDAWLLEHPEDLDALDLLMVVGPATGHAGAVLAVLDREARALPADVDVAQRQAVFADSIGHAPRLLAAVERLQSLDGHRDPGLDLDRAHALLRLHRPAEALALIEQVRARDPDWPQIDLWFAQALVDLGRADDALDVLRSTDPRPGEIPWRADLLRAAGDAAAARLLIEQALAEGPTARPYLDAGLRWAADQLDHDWGLALAARRAADAEGFWRRALVAAGHADVALARMGDEVAAGDPEALRDSAALLLDEDPDEALRRLRRAVAARPEDDRARSLLAGTLVELGLATAGGDAMLEEARGIARSLLADHPDDPATLNLLAWSCAAADQCLDEALPLARRAVDIDPADGHFVDTLGWTLARRGDLEQAERVLEEASALLPGNAEVARHLAAVRAGVLPAVRSPGP